MYNQIMALTVGPQAKAERARLWAATADKNMPGILEPRHQARKARVELVEELLDMMAEACS